MKIVHIIGFFNPDAWFRENYYTKYLSDKHEISIITSNISFPYKTIEIKKYQVGKSKYGKIDLYRLKSLHIKDMVYFDFKSILHEINPDIVHIYEFRQFISILVSKFCISNGIPFVYEQEQRNPGLTLLGKIKSRFLIERKMRELLQRASLIRTVTPGAAKYVENVTGITNNISIATLGYDRSRSFWDKNATCKFIKPTEKIIVGVTGKLNKIKRVEVIIEAFKKSLRDDIKLIIVGSMENEYYLKLNKFSDDNISIYNEFMNKQELNSFYSLSDYVVFTSLSISYFEAIGTGATIIIPKGSGSEHLKSNNIIKYGDASCISYMENNIINGEVAVEELIMIFRKIRKPGQRIFDDKYNIEHIVHELERQYIEAVRI